MNKQSTTATNTRATDETVPLSEKQIDELAEAQANIDEVWDEPIYVQHLKHDSPLTGERDAVPGEK